MLKLDRVEISGFKSFVEKVELAFPSQITAVVGPNGCGKSNICDAVAWALGEQSAKSLRGERMDDVIFNGSSKRRPLGMAEVVVTLSRKTGRNGNGNGNGHEADDADVENDADEELEQLRIGRRVYREGHGEYFLNDKQVRLKDIQDHLLGTGLGVRAYSVIEQGRIDQVLSTKPQDRRRLIEEAAGITKYKLRKKLAEAKLEETRGNLLRLTDILSEIERNCASLKRQASRASRYREQSDLLRAARSALARVRFDLLSAEAAEAARIKEERRDREASAAAALGRAESELASARFGQEEAAGLRDRLRDALSRLEASIQRDDALLEANRRAVSDLTARREALAREGETTSADRTRAVRELAELEDRLARAIEEARARSAAREEADRRASEAAAAVSALEGSLESARAASLAASGDRVAARNARHEVDLVLERLAASLARLEAEIASARAELTQREADWVSAQAEHRRSTDAAEATVREIAAGEEELARLARACEEAEAARLSAHEALGEIEHRRGALSEVLRSRESGVAAARAALAAGGEHVEGSLADRLSPARGWEEAVDLLLAGDADALLTGAPVEQALAAAREIPALRLLRSGWRGKARSPESPANARGWSGVLTNWNDLSPAERSALPRAGFVETLEDALALSETDPETTWVTPRREAVRGPVVRAFRSAPEAAGLFTLRRELDALESALAGARDACALADEAASRVLAARRREEESMPARRERGREAAAAASAAAARLEGKRADLDRLRHVAEAAAAEAQAFKGEVEGHQRRRRELTVDEARHAEREASAREDAEKLATALLEARSHAIVAAEELAHRRTEAEVAAERRRSAEAAREKLLEARGALERRLGDAEEEARRLAQRAQELSAEETEARQSRIGALAERDVRARELTGAAESADAASRRVAESEEAAKSARSVLDAEREARFEAEVAETRIRADFDHHAAAAREEFGVGASELPAPEDASPEAIAALEEQAASLAASLERLGPVNVLAYEEYQQEAERLQFLSTQKADLEKSVADLQESIRKINATSSERFARAFAAINANFTAMFTRLFRGGTAQMRLLDENDPLDSGVEIVAQPPGKRNQSIQLLSGGEKALTAIALLMAIFRYKPSPFCILDEVDAPLDEANIDRFTNLLREMTEETQFIAITHNKRTMETADVLYGVTMEEPGCSKVVSVKFD
jgi:chromosome segregation protein